MDNLLIINNATDSLIYSIKAHLSMSKPHKTHNINTIITIVYLLKTIGGYLYV
jgi:hypothetical protein